MGRSSGGNREGIVGTRGVTTAEIEAWRCCPLHPQKKTSMLIRRAQALEVHRLATSCFVLFSKTSLTDEFHMETLGFYTRRTMIM